MDDVDIRPFIVETLDEANEFVRWLGQSRPVLAIDTETCGLHWWEDRLRTVQFGDASGVAWVLSFEQGGWGALAIEALSRYEGQLVMHNAKFDLHVLERQAGLRLRGLPQRVDDTALMSLVLDHQAPSALKQLAKLYVNPKADAMQEALDTAMTKQGWNYATVPMSYDVYWAYAATDAVWTAKLWELFTPLVHQSGLWDVYQLDLAAQDVLRGMEDRGVKIDQDFTQRTWRELSTWVDEAKRWVKENYGISATSNAQLAERLIADGIELTKMTPGGDISVDADALSSIHHPLAQTSLRIRQLQKVSSTYLKNFLELTDAESLIHPSIRCIGARTGRMSMSEPNLQNLPRDWSGRPEAIAVRNCFVPRDDHLLVLADFDQIEQRMMAHFTATTVDDSAMAEEFMRGGDFFTNMARRIYGDDTILKQDPRRQMTKNASYAKGYGAGTAKFAITAGIMFDVAQSFIDIFDQTYPGIRRFQQHMDKVVRNAKETEGLMYARGPFGRIHRPDEHKVYTVVNYLIQGTAADVLKMKMIELAHAGLDAYMVLPVHDEVIFDVPLSAAREVVQTCKAVMPETQHFVVPLTVGVDVVDRWGKKFTEEFIDVGA